MMLDPGRVPDHVDEVAGGAAPDRFQDVQDPRPAPVAPRRAPGGQQAERRMSRAGMVRAISTRSRTSVRVVT